MIWWLLGGIGAAVVALAVYDLVQRRHAILRNFPIVGHFRYLIEGLGPELRQYIVASNDEERPFSRDERRWVYASSKGQNNYFGFGTDNDPERTPGYVVVRHSAFPRRSPRPGDPDHDPDHAIPCKKVLGAARGRAKAFRPASVINISAMSFGSLSGAAVEAINRGAARTGCLHNTGEGGIAPQHRLGGDLVWQLGTGYFGCRNEDGSFSMDELLANLEASPTVRALEIKLSQGAKPGAGGILPRAKITPEIAAIRGIPRDRDAVSPARHSTFDDVDGLVDWVEELAAATGLPVGIKSAVGELGFWRELTTRMKKTGRGVDFVSIDGGEGGTGAAPLVFSDHLSLPFRRGFSEVFHIFQDAGLDREVVFVGAGKLGLPKGALVAFGLGCDLIAVAREAMLAIGCIQAQLCHTNRCPTGVATQSRWLAHGLDPTHKASRLARYVVTLRKDLLAVARACGVEHPADIGAERVTLLDPDFGDRSLAEVFRRPSAIS